jgi:hypothetical protein
LALKNERTWSGFLWYLVTAPGQGYVHKPSMAHPAKIFNTASTILENKDIQPIGHFSPAFSQETTNSKTNLS